MNEPRTHQGKGSGGARHGRRDQESRPEQAGGRKNQSHRQRKPSDILPDPEILEAYDYVVEGSAKDILEMFKTEQAHRHQWERRALRIHMFSTILGQFLGFFIAIAIFVSAAVVGMHGDSTIGAFIWVFGMAIVTMAALVWWYAKSLGQRPLFARPAMRTSFRPEKE